MSDLLKSTSNNVTGRTSGYWNVDGEADCVGASDFFGLACAREKRPLMGRDVENLGIIPKDGLCPIAVVDVPVDDEHSLALRRQCCRADGNVVEQAEPH